MNKLKNVIGEIFQSPMNNMSFVSYFQYVNTSGKVTAKSLMDTCTILLTFCDEQEGKNDLYESNFKEIESILIKLVEQKLEIKQEISPVPEIHYKDGTLPEVPSQEPEVIVHDTNYPSDINTVKDIPSEADSFMCPECSKILKTKLALAGHSRSHKKVL